MKKYGQNLSRDKQTNFEMAMHILKSQDWKQTGFEQMFNVLCGLFCMWAFNSSFKSWHA